MTRWGLASRTLLAIVVTLGGFHLQSAPAAAFTSRGGESTCHATSDRVRLTFDDGASAGRAGQILDILKAKRVRAGFFVVGSWAAANPGIMQRIRTEGHWTGNHTASHRNLTRLSSGAI